MEGQRTFAENVIQFNNEISHEVINLPAGFKILNPFDGEEKEQIKKIEHFFYKRYYDDNHIRRVILGSSPARRGSALVGIPFENASYLQQETGVEIKGFHVNKSSNDFLLDVIREYGGRTKFYADFYMNFVCPLGIVKRNTSGNWVNCNYYEDKALQEVLLPFIIKSLKKQMEFGVDASVCYCIGSGENFRFLSKINSEYTFFNRIIPLEHPRFIMQYNSNRKDYFIKKYINELCD